MTSLKHAQSNETSNGRLRVIAAFISLLLISFFVYNGSYAAFSGTTDNVTNTWAAGQVELTNDPDGSGFGDATTAEFTESALIPGDSDTGCIDVRYDGSVTNPLSLTNVHLYIANLVDTDFGGDAGAAAQLSDDLDMVVAIHPALSTCATPVGVPVQIFSGSLDSMPSAFGGGIDSLWKPVLNGETRAFQFTWTLGSDTADDAQGDAAQVDFVWEIQTS
ncbi:MAG: hypothetical protein OES13_09065 [Acidimicrobiia bacterium]|nr:hypothetical protein [Acidimicrobiia bacterium]